MDAIPLIKEFEHCSLIAYQDQGGRWTVGWGRARNVREGDTCTAAQAEAWILEDAQFFETAVLACVGKVTLTDAQLAALTSFCFNVGLGYKGVKSGFQELIIGGPSTMLVRLRQKNFPAAAEEFLRWDKVGGNHSVGLRRRREAEKALFLKAG
jgi:lysozyme